MTTAANHSGYGNPSMGGSPWGPGPGAPWEHPEWGYRQWLYASKPLWIVATVLGFIFCWPLGLLLLFLMIGVRRMGCFGYGRYRGFQGGWQAGGPPPWAAWRSFWCAGPQTQSAPPTSGNRAFDEYRAETLRRLEEEQKEFGTFLDRLRFAKDKAEFDQFMAELRQRPPAAPEQSQGPSPQA
jgi:hypothetical protein